jgi:hypothetical protein
LLILRPKKPVDRAKIVYLEFALVSARRIGATAGILIERYKMPTKRLLLCC